MIRVKQTRFTSPLGTVKGNCLQACVASLLELPLMAVPDFVAMDPDTWVDQFETWLDSKGYVFEGMHYFVNDVGTELGTWDTLLAESKGVDGYFIVGGDSPREWVTAGHAVIYRDDEMRWDPHAGRQGLKLRRYAYIIHRKQEDELPKPGDVLGQRLDVHRTDPESVQVVQPVQGN